LTIADSHFVFNKFADEQKSLRFQSTLNKLLIFKNRLTNKLDGRLITYVPEIFCSKPNTEDKNDITLNSVKNHFSGTIEYQTLTGTFCFFLNFQNNSWAHTYGYSPGKFIQLASTKQNVSFQLKKTGENLKVQDSYFYRVCTTVYEGVQAYQSTATGWFANEDPTTHYISSWRIGTYTSDA